MLLLCASFLFYLAFSWEFLLLFISLITVNYFIGMAIYSGSGRYHKYIYISGLVFNILILCFFKYFGYLNIDFVRIAAFFHLNYPGQVINIVMPFGLSYMIFSLISYLIDIKRKDTGPEKNLGILMTYFLFFPKVLQGPIERAGRLIPQFRMRHDFDYSNVTEGLKRMAWGFFKKLVIADNLAVFVNAAFSDSQEMKGPVLFLGIVAFAFQLYADFSGYTDIALGSARIFGFELMENFRRPYLARSVREFWTRWHISLSSWFRDYIFLPLAYAISRKLPKEKYLGLRADKGIYIIATTVTFLFCGFWHGAGLNFVIFGLLFGIYINFDILTRGWWQKINIITGIKKSAAFYHFLQVLSTFILILFVWIFFRADNFTTALRMIDGLFAGWSFGYLNHSWIYLKGLGMNERIIGIMVISTGILIATDILSERRDILQRISEKSVYFRWAIYFLIILAIIVYGGTETKQFIYTQF